MILYKYGGLYSDLDVEAIHSFQALEPMSVVLPITEPSGVSNDLMLSEPGHPFFREVLEGLKSARRRWQWPWVPPHFRVMLTTGPMFLTRQLRISVHRGQVHLLAPKHYSSQRPPDAWVRHHPGSTWGAWDSKLFYSVYRAWKRYTCRA